MGLNFRSRKGLRTVKSFVVFVRLQGEAKKNFDLEVVG